MRSSLPQIIIAPQRLPRFGEVLKALVPRFEGRIGRRGFWFGSAVVAVLLFVAERWLFKYLPHQASIIMVALAAFALYPFGALATKRGLDRGHSSQFGVRIVLITVLAGLAARWLSGGPLAVYVNLLNIALWFFTLVDLGLMPSVSEKPIVQKQVGVRRLRLLDKQA